MTDTAKRNIYLQTISIEEAVARTQSALDRERFLRTERIETEHSGGRVTAEAIYARFSSPTFHSAAMDGVAVRAADTFSAREGRPVILRRDDTYVPVNTGHPLPEGYDAVVMIENVDPRGDDAVALETPVAPWQHVRRIGEDIVATELLFSQNHTLSFADIGALLSAGIWEVTVRERIRIHFIPTGDEVLDFRKQPVPKAGQVVESNSQMLADLVRQWGCEAHCVPPVPDRRDVLEKTIDQALANGAHVVVVLAGSSAGSRDFTRSVFDALGEVLVHGIAAMPGKPTVVGTCRGRLLVGSPGYPVSAVVCFEKVIKPVLFWLMRQSAERRPEVEVELARKIPSKAGVEEFVRASIGRIGPKYVAVPLAKGAGMITSLTRAQGWIRIPAPAEGLEAGSRTKAELLVGNQELERTLVVVGSHDNTLDLLANILKGLPEPVTLASTHVGSMGGLTALKNKTGLMAGMHLFDPLSNDFNFPFLEKYAPSMVVRVFNLAIRHQGLIVARGNPLGIKGVGDLKRRDVQFINRQRGAGTRILLDHHLQQAGIDPDQVRGYAKEEFTHMAVAVNVKTGIADCGLGIMAAARALDLDFVPLALERYDLVVRAEHEDDVRVGAVLEILGMDEFKEKIRALGGYETEMTGMVMEPGMGLGREKK